MFNAFRPLFVIFHLSIFGSGWGVMAVVESWRKIVIVNSLSGIVWMLVITNLSESIVREEAASQSFRHIVFTIAWMPFAEITNSWKLIAFAFNLTLFIHCLVLIGLTSFISTGQRWSAWILIRYLCFSYSVTCIMHPLIIFVLHLFNDFWCLRFLSLMLDLVLVSHILVFN